MLEELRKYENLGSPDFFYELFDQLVSSGTPWKEEHIRQYFYNRIVDNSSVFDGCLPLAELIGAVSVDSSGRVLLIPSLVPALTNRGTLADALLRMLLASLRDDQIFHEVFSAKNLSFDVVYRRIHIDGAAFPFRYANFRRLLLDFGFLQHHPDTRIRAYLVNSKYKGLFDQEIIPELRRRKLNAIDLEENLERNRIHGEQAERFVLDYEKRRLASHPQLGTIQIISSYDVMAGYDIVSFESPASSEIDRFIEVKSFSTSLSFHWSRNEIDVARLRRDKYFLYLVDRSSMHDPSYEPIVLRDPYVGIMKNDMWLKRPDSFGVSPK